MTIIDPLTQWGGNGRVREVAALSPEFRHLWLAGQLDEVEHKVDAGFARLGNQIIEGFAKVEATELARARAATEAQAKIMTILTAVLVSIVTLSLTLLITRVVS